MAPSTPMSRCKILGFQQLQILPGAAKLLGLPWSMGAKCWPPSVTAALSRLLQRPQPVPFKSFSRGSLRGEGLGRDINLGFCPNDWGE